MLSVERRMLNGAISGLAQLNTHPQACPKWVRALGQSAGNSWICAPHPPSAPFPHRGGEKASESSFRSYETADLLAFSPPAVGEKVPKADEGGPRFERPSQFGQHSPPGSN